MDRLFGKELSNLLNPIHYNFPANKVPSRSTRDAGLNKDHHKRGETRSTSVVIEKKESSSSQSSTEREEPGKDVQLVPEYFDDCLNFMLLQESKDYKVVNYFPEQTNINEKMRGILLDWIAELHYKFKMFPQTLFATTMILDLYLSKKQVKKDNLQLVGAAAFFIAAKYEETYQVPEVDDLVHFAAKVFNKQELIRTEADIIEALNFNLIMTTSYRFFEALAKISGMDIKNFYLAQYVLELSLLDIKFVEYKPSVLASSVIYLINKIRKRSESWPDLLLAATGYQQKDLKICARQLCYLLQKSDELPNTKSLKRKFSSTQYHEVTRIKLQRKKQ